MPGRSVTTCYQGGNQDAEPDRAGGRSRGPPSSRRALADYDAGRNTRERPAREQDEACQDSITRIEATGSPVVSDGEQHASSFATYPLADTLAGTGLA
jgi:hypothetical protein